MSMSMTTQTFVWREYWMVAVAAGVLLSSASLDVGAKGHDLQHRQQVVAGERAAAVDAGLLLSFASFDVEAESHNHRGQVVGMDQTVAVKVKTAAVAVAVAVAVGVGYGGRQGSYQEKEKELYQYHCHNHRGGGRRY
ncbi:hypothetical protein Ancab_002763 [Ancistrocladus abbreviatus]